MKMSSAFPSKWLKASDLQGREVTVTIARCELEMLNDKDDGNNIDKEQKPVLYFEGKQKGLVLNKTNATKLSSAYGDDTDGWEGKPVILYPDRTSFQGQMVDCLRVRIPLKAAAPGEEAPF